MESTNHCTVIYRYRNTRSSVVLSNISDRILWRTPFGLSVQMISWGMRQLTMNANQSTSIKEALPGDRLSIMLYCQPVASLPDLRSAHLHRSACLRESDLSAPHNESVKMRRVYFFSCSLCRFGSDEAGRSRVAHISSFRACLFKVPFSD